MSSSVQISNKIERRTYIKGELRAKYIGFLDEKISNKSHVNFYSLEILDARVEIKSEDIRKWHDNGIFEEFSAVEAFPGKLPPNTEFSVVYENGTSRYFKLDLLDVRIKDTVITDRIIEEHRVFGTLTSMICGYFVHYEAVNNEGDSSTEEIISQPFPQSSKNDDTSKKVTTTRLGFTEIFQGLASGLSVILGVMLIIPVILYSWPYLVVTAATYLLSELSSVFPKVTQRIAGIFNNLLILLFIFLLGIGLVSLIDHDTVSPVVKSADQAGEQSTISPIPLPQKDTLQSSGIQPADSTSLQQQDSLIMHYRIWEGYNGERYSGYLSVRSSDFSASGHYRNHVVQPVMSPAGFGFVFEGLGQFDDAKLVNLYNLFDSLNQVNKLDQMRFAEMVVSCIQDIPYTLILEQECNPRQYEDAFVRDYLNSGGKCRPFVKYGVLSPVEFVATLDGDCDTRVLLLYTILKHYGYGVALLVSSHYQHAILGIQLPYGGVAKTINMKRYVVWETTAEGVPPGVLPSQMADMSHWLPALISN
jgi:hypothetical protein